MLDASELERYARHIVLREVGGPGQAKLKAARVLVVGAGGLGAPVLLYLAAAGVGTLGVVDDDTVSLSNLQRQVIFGTKDVGKPKVERAASAVAGLNPHVSVKTHGQRLETANAQNGPEYGTILRYLEACRVSLTIRLNDKTNDTLVTFVDDSGEHPERLPGETRVHNGMRR